MSKQVPQQARVVVIGGGVVGCSILYHLAHLGWSDVLLLERRQLTCGTTWHAAGLVGQLRGSMNMTRLAKYTAELYAGLEAETGQATGFRQHGSISIATTQGRLAELARNASMAKVFGLRVDVLDRAEIAARYPLIETADVLGGIAIPSDGQANPVDVTQALARGARALGATILEQTEVARLVVDGRRVTGVETTAGERVRADCVVLAAGMWTRALAAGIGVNVPLHACEHFYIVTEPVPGLPAQLPVLRDYDGCAYYKEDAGKILLGAFEPRAKPWGMDGIPEAFCFDQLAGDFAHFEPILETAMRRLPLLREVGIKTFFCGPESFTPDVRYNLGLAPGFDNCFVAAGLNSIGIQSAGGIGKVLAEWIRDGQPSMDLWEVDVRRHQPFQGNRAYLRERVSESLGLLYAMHWPHRQFETGRGVRRSPLHDALERKGACFGQAWGWERPNWYAPSGTQARYQYSWQRQNWFEHAAREHAAARNGVALFDLSSLAKFRVQGRDAWSVLERVSANDLARAQGRIIYTPWLNDRGTFEAEVMIVGLADDDFLVLGGGETEVRDWAWLARQVPGEAHCVLTNMTSAYAVIGVMGPRSRALLQALTPAALTPAEFPYGSSRVIELGFAQVRVTRVSYVGELGFELLIPTEFAAGVYEVLAAAGEAHGLVHAGFHALNSLRLEKAYPQWGLDLSIEDTPYEAGLMHGVGMTKQTAFIGRDALAARRERPVTRRLVQLLLADPEPMLYQHEPIYRDGTIVGSVSSGAYGYTLGGAVGLGYVTLPQAITAQTIAASTFEVEVEGVRHPARASLGAMYDPGHARLGIRESG